MGRRSDDEEELELKAFAVILVAYVLALLAFLALRGG